jgi:glycosyltransferase involved in cell wall biosynthesis
VAAENSTARARDIPRWPITDVIIPALNEATSLPLVLGDLPADRVRRVSVVDNGSTDATAEVARELGATVVREPRRGYGRACLAGIEALQRQTAPPEVVVFLDADYSDHPEELPGIVQPIADDQADLVIGSRMLGDREPGALLPQARFGNLFAAWLIRALYGLRVTDLGPFRAIRWRTLLALRMADLDFGWTAEMQVKAARLGIRYREVPASYRRRIGVSKITGTLSGTVRAGWKILYTVLRYRSAGV